MCCHTESKVQDQTCCLTQPWYAKSELASASTDPPTPADVSHGCHWVQFWSYWRNSVLKLLAWLSFDVTGVNQFWSYWRVSVLTVMVWLYFEVMVCVTPVSKLLAWLNMGVMIPRSPTLMINGENNNVNNHIEKRNSNFLQSPHCAVNCLQHVRSRGQGTVVCKSRAKHIEGLSCTSRVSRSAKGQLNC